MSAQQVLDRGLLAELVQTMAPGGYVFWGVEYTGFSGRNVTLAWFQGESTRERAEQDVADLAANRGIVGRVVSLAVTVGGWSAG